MTNLTNSQKRIIAEWCEKSTIRANHISATVLRDACENLGIPNDGYFVYSDVVEVGQLLEA